MQPQTPYQVPPPPPNQMPPIGGGQVPNPDYSFLNDQPKKSNKLPFFGNSFLGKILIILLGAVFVVILLIIVKGIVSPAKINKNAYEILVERQHEMIHIISNDVTTNAQGQLSQSDKNFAATAQLALVTAQSKTIIFLRDYGDKISQKKLATVYSPSIDQELSNAIAANNFDSQFKSVMQQQIISYQQELKTAYAGTRTAGGKSLILSEYKEAKDLLTALSSNSS